MDFESNPQLKKRLEGHKLIVEERAEVEYEVFEAIRYTEQVVSGMLYQVLFKVSKKPPVEEDFPEALK